MLPWFMIQLNPSDKQWTNLLTCNCFPVKKTDLLFRQLRDEHEDALRVSQGAVLLCLFACANVVCKAKSNKVL